MAWGEVNCKPGCSEIAICLLTAEPATVLPCLCPQLDFQLSSASCHSTLGRMKALLIPSWLLSASLSDIEQKSETFSKPVCLCLHFLQPHANISLSLKNSSSYSKDFPQGKFALGGNFAQVSDALADPFLLSLLPPTQWFPGVVAKSPMAVKETNTKS